MTDLTPEQEEIDAIARLARSADGALIRRYFRRQLESCRLTDDNGALQRHEGARILARDFMIHMDRGLEPHAGNDPAEEPVLRASARPAVEQHPRGIKRRVAYDPTVGAFLANPGAYPNINGAPDGA